MRRRARATIGQQGTEHVRAFTKARTPLYAAPAMTLEAALAAAATLIALAFACSTFERWLTGRRLHHLLWTVSLSMFTVASGALWWGVAAGWSGGSYRTFFLFGAILNVVWLALGNVVLLIGAERTRGVVVGVLLASGFAAGVVSVAPFRAALPPSGLPQGKEMFDPLPRVLAALGSGGGALVVLGCTGWSLWRLWRSRRHQERAAAMAGRPGRLAAGNALIALGTVVLGASGTLAGRLGEDEAFAVTLVVGVTVLFAGFLVAGTAGRRPLQAVPASTPARSREAG